MGIAGLLKIGATAAKAGKLAKVAKNSNVLATAIGVGQKIKANRLKKKSEEAMPANEDAEVRKMQRQFARRKRAFQTGTASASQRRSMEKMFATGAQRTMKFGVGGRAGLNKMQEIFNQGMQTLGQQNLQGELSYAGLEKDAINSIAQRKLELAMQKHDELAAEAATVKQSSNMNLGAVMGRTAGVGKVASAIGGGGMNTKTTPAVEEEVSDTEG